MDRNLYFELLTFLWTCEVLISLEIDEPIPKFEDFHRARERRGSISESEKQWRFYRKKVRYVNPRRIKENKALVTHSFISC